MHVHACVQETFQWIDQRGAAELHFSTGEHFRSLFLKVTSLLNSLTRSVHNLEAVSSSSFLAGKMKLWCLTV